MTETSNEKYTLHIELPGLPPTTNASNVHWRVRAKRAKHWKGLTVNAALLQQKRGARVFERAKLTLTRFSSKEPDYDGLVSSFKHVIDGLIVAGVISDDKVSVIGQPTYLWVEAPPSKGKITIKVEAA